MKPGPRLVTIACILMALFAASFLVTFALLRKGGTQLAADGATLYYVPFELGVQLEAAGLVPDGRDVGDAAACRALADDDPKVRQWLVRKAKDGSSSSDLRWMALAVVTRAGDQSTRDATVLELATWVAQWRPAGPVEKGLRAQMAGQLTASLVYGGVAPARALELVRSMDPDGWRERVTSLLEIPVPLMETWPPERRARYECAAERVDLLLGLADGVE